MIRVKEAILVEGRYDKSKLSALVDGLILEAGGFSLFRDKEKLRFLREVAKDRGLIILTDSDGAGFLIRGRLSSLLPPEHLKHAYIPDVYGKERRKAQPSKEGKLGVEGMDLPTLQAALERAGATLEEGLAPPQREKVRKSDLYELGLSGQPDSEKRRKALQRALALPERLSANGLVQAASALYGREEFLRLAGEFFQQEEGDA